MASLARTALSAVFRAGRQSSLPARTLCTSSVCRGDILEALEKTKADVVAGEGVKYDNYPLRLPCPPYVLADEELFEAFYNETVNQPQNYEEVMIGHGINDPFEFDIKRVAPGSKSFPHLVPTTNQARWVGCYCAPDDPYAVWSVIHVGESKRCGCGAWYRCLDYSAFLEAQSEQVKAMHEAGTITVSPATLAQAEMISEIIQKPECRARLEKWIEAGRH